MTGESDEGGSVAWEALDWPDLSATFPQPRASTLPPATPDVPADIGARVLAAERRRGRAAKACIALGCGVWCAGVAVYVLAGRRAASGAASVWTLLLMGAGLVVALPLAAYLTWRLGPTWEQRQLHWRLLHWEHECAAWRDREREHYLASLPPAERARLRRALREADRPDGG